MVQVNNKCTFQTANENMIEESLADKVKKEGHFFRQALIYNKPRATKLELVEFLVEMLKNFDLQTFLLVKFDDCYTDILKENLLTQNHLNAIHSNCFRLLLNGPILVSDHSVLYFDHCIYQYLLCVISLYLRIKIFLITIMCCSNVLLREKLTPKVVLWETHLFFITVIKLRKKMLLNHELTKTFNTTYCWGSRVFDEFH